MDSGSVTPGLQQLRALSHPARVRMLGLLRVDGPATATMLATRLGLNSGATSYHLRQLAQHGFVVDDESRGNGRERWWKAAHSATTAPEPAAEGEGDEALDAYLQSVVVVMTELLQRSVEERPLLSQEWRQASRIGDWVIDLTPRRARAVVDALVADIEAVPEDGGVEDAEAFVIQLHAFPLPGRTGPVS